MNIRNKLRVGAGTTVFAALLTGFLTNAQLEPASDQATGKAQDRVPAATETVPAEFGKAPLVSPAFEMDGRYTVIEKVPLD